MMMLPFVVPAQAQNHPVPVPRPSMDQSAPEPDPYLADQSYLSTPGLSPGALLDPTEGMTFNFSDMLPPDPHAGAPIDLAPEAAAAAAEGSLFGGNNPLLGQGPSTVQPVPFRLEARLREEGPAVPQGVSWRVFGSTPMPDGKLPFVGEAQGGSIEVRLSPGEYFVHAAYGRAGTTRKVNVGYGSGGEAFVLNAGGLRLSALVGHDGQALNAQDVNFDIYAPDEDGSNERILLVPNAVPDKIVGLNAGIYHIVCRYGEANAVVRADIRVEAGNLTEATIYQKAARLTLKLVTEQGGEALANTSWSILTPQGDIVIESVGAFPSVVLAEGEYRAIARNQDSTYERAFAVEAGLNRDVEVLAR